MNGWTVELNGMVEWMNECVSMGKSACKSKYMRKSLKLLKMLKKLKLLKLLKLLKIWKISK